MNQTYPKDFRENMEWRRDMLLRCSEDPAYLTKVKELFFRDPLFAFNGFFYTLDIRKKPFTQQPFCTYPFQDQAILELVSVIQESSGMNTKDLLWEKSRDMGATWMILGTFMWFWLNPDFPSDFLLGSRIQDYVDKIGDPRTHFHKLRYLLYKFPQWLVPKGFDKRKNDNFMKLENPETGATLTGESNNANFSTQGRYTAILYDEFAKWESTDTAAWTSGGDASPCRIANSTPFGAAGKHYELATDGRTKKIVMHWSLHPEKRGGLACLWPKPEEADDEVNEYHWVGLTAEWYEKEKLRRTAQEVAQELDIDYIGAGSPIFDGRAGKRIGTLLRSNRQAETFRINTEDFSPLHTSDFRRFISGVENPNDYEDYLLVFDKPRIDRNYVLGVDVAEGKEDGDYSVVKVLDRETESVVATFASQINEVDLAKAVVLMTLLYTFEDREEPWWAVEANGPGLATFDIVVEMYDLPNPFMMMRFDVAKQTASYRKGWWTDTNSRRKLVSKAKEWLLLGLGWCDPRCCREMTTFVKSKSGRPEAKSGTHDDEVMCFGIALMVNELAPLDEYEEPEKPIRELQDHLTKPSGKEEVLSIEQRCLATIMRNQKVLSSDDYIGSNFESVEELGSYN